MNVRKKSETATTVTLEWDLTAEQEGYLPLIDGSEILTDGKRHPGTKVGQHEVKIGKPTDGQPHDYGVAVLVRGPTGSVRVPEDTDPPPTGRTITYDRITLQPGDSGDGVSGRSNRWVVYTSDNTPRPSPTPQQTRGRYFVDGETWYGIMHLRPHHDVNLGRIINFHDSAASGYQWGSVSPVAIDIPPQALTLEYASSCNKGKEFPTPFRIGEWNTVWMKLGLSVNCSGSVQIWVTNSQTDLSKPAIVNLTGVRTINPRSDFWPGVQLWRGGYKSSGWNSGSPVTIDHAADLWGKSWSAAYADKPTFVTEWGSARSSVQRNAGTVNTGDFRVPDAIDL